MNREGRIALLTLALLPIGAALGAAAGVVALGIAAQLTGDLLLALQSWDALQIAAYLGAALGAAALTLGAWSLVRRVAPTRFARRGVVRD